MSDILEKSIYKPDYDVIANWVKEGSRVLDLGCGNGMLLETLIKKKKVSGIGIDNDADSLDACVAKGLSVVQVDLDQGLKDFPDKNFDYVILNDTLQALYRPLYVLQEMIRVGKKAIVGFPNFAHLAARSYLFFLGKMPMSKTLPYMWYNTPNIHFMTIKDFQVLCKEQNFKILKKIYFGEHQETIPSIFANLLATEAVFMIQK